MGEQVHSGKEYFEKLSGKFGIFEFFQLSEFVELCLVKRLIAGGKKSDHFGTLVGRLHFAFCSSSRIGAFRGETVKTDRETLERDYAETVAMCRQIVTQMSIK